MEEKRTLLSALASVQAELKVGKGRKNLYGNFMCRSSADIFAHLEELDKAETALMAKIMGR